MSGSGPTMALLLTFGVLTSCGGGNGGVASTPTPTPTPVPSPTYTPLADLTGNQSFQTAGLALDTGPGMTGSTTSHAFGSGIRLDYNAAADSYTLTAPEGISVSLDGSNINPNQSGPSQTAYDRTSGTTRDVVFLIRPAVNGVALNYLLFGSWNHIDTTTNNSRFNLAVGGVPTQASDMPRSGTADYDMTVGGSLVPTGSTPYSLAGHSTGTLSVNFGAGTLTTSMTLRGQSLVGGNSAPVIDFGSLSATGTLASGGPGFAGTIDSNGFTGQFVGAFFGPQAVEAAYLWEISGNGLGGRGANAAVRK